MSADPVRAIADAVLYEGYILWPYRRSALKNQRRFTFGGVFPPAHSELHPDDPSAMQTEVLLRASEPARVRITLRFLQVVERMVAGPDGRELDELVVGGERYLSWEEAVEREIRAEVAIGEELLTPIAIPSAREREELPEHTGALIRSWEQLDGVMHVQARPIAADVWRLSVEIRNSTSCAPPARTQALRHAFCSTHTLLRAEEGSFVSLTDPPPELLAATAACRNVGTWPVRVGDPDDSTVLSSPIILEDYPQIAPESPGDLFDGGEIDQMLVLNILTLTDGEKAEMRASDPRAAEILARTEALTPQQLMRLHGTIREFGLAR